MAEEGVSWRDYVDSRLADTAKAVEIAQHAAEKAVDKSDAATDTRIEIIEGLMSGMVSRREYDARHVSLEEKNKLYDSALQALREDIALARGAALGNQRLITVLFAGLATIAGVGTLIFFIVHG